VAVWHSLRHTYASLQLAAGVINIKQLSRVLGHHSAGFTVDVYTHLLDYDEPPALDLHAALGQHLGQHEPPNPTEIVAPA
jgi:integrase